MNRFSVLLLFGVWVLVSSCNGGILGGAAKKNLHDRYAHQLSEAGLKETILGKLWFAAADKALQSPEPITLPYRQTGYFAADRPRAVGLHFTAPRGAKLIFQLQTKSLNSFRLYTDLWQARPGNEPRLILSLDSASGQFTHEVEDEDEMLILRLQPELLGSGEYTLSISVGPSLAFPVPGGKGRIESVWGDARDAGARRHEGIDIFAPKRTPVVAAADGTVHRVGTNRLGGKVIFLRPKGKNLSLYYAHLDEQLVSSGDRVSVGDTIGLVGNTGNARTTPPHLHFGIYAFGGAINPFNFVSPTVKRAPALSFSSGKLNTYYRTTRRIHNEHYNLEENTVLLATDAGSKGLLAQTPTGRTVVLPLSSVQPADNQLIVRNINDTAALLEAPLSSSPQKRKLLPGTPVRVQGYYNQFAFVSAEPQVQGWLPRSALR